MTDTPIDHLINERIAAATGKHAALLSDLERRIAALENGPGPGGGGIPLHLQPIPDDLLIFEVDPYRPRTYNHERGLGQAWAAGRMYQLNDRVEYVGRQIPAEHRLGYNVQMSPDGQVEAWPMEDGTTTRYGVITVDGVRFFRLACQSRPHLDGYNPETGIHWFRNGQPSDVGVGWRIDTGIDRRAGRSDPRTFDAARSELSGIGANMLTGRGAPVHIWGVALQGHRWMQTRASIGGPFDLHAAGWTTTGQMVASISNGRLYFWSKSSKTTEPITWGHTTNHDLTNVQLFDMPAPEPGELLELVVASRPDRSGDTSVFEIYRGNGLGDLEHLHTTTKAHGYRWDLDAKNGENYPKIQLYPWGEWNTPGSHRVQNLGLPLFNHDPTLGNVYDLRLAAFAVTDEATLGHDYDMGVRMMAAHVAATAAART